MRVNITETKNSKSFYIIKSFRANGKSTSKIVEKLGTLEEVTIKANGQDPYEWAKARAKELTENEKKKDLDVMVKFSPNKQLPTGKQSLFNGGYLFIKQIYYHLGLHKICEKISDSNPFQYDLNAILSQLVFSRILFPGSKLEAFKTMPDYLETPDIKLHQFYRALEILAAENDFIQSQLYKNSTKVVNRNSKILYYDCTNFFFEIEQADGDKQYGKSKEHRPNPIVQMGLFMDGNGIPLAFDMTPGNTNEQITLRPLEKKILKDFELAQFVVCTDAGLSSESNKRFNNIQGRAFLTTQSIKKSKKLIQEWALGEHGWRTSDPKDSKEYTLTEINQSNNKNITYYKERWFSETGKTEQRMIVSYSLKYKEYQEKIRSKQIERAEKVIANGTRLTKKISQNDFKRFIKQTNITGDGEIAAQTILKLDHAVIGKESKYDGFYAVTTNLEDDVAAIINVNHARWEIEETFRIMKSEFKARPVHLSRDDRIKAHFLTCFIAMTIFRILEKKLNNAFTHCEIIQTLQDMNFLEIIGDGFIPTYTRTDLTDQLHDAFGFRTDTQIVLQKNMKKIFKLTKCEK